MGRNKELDLESISALLDGESDDLSLRRLLKSYETNDEISETWRRYNLTQSLLHEDTAIVKPSLRESIKEQIAEEEDLRPQNNILWLEGLFKVGLAASVAVLCVLLFQGNSNSIPTGKRLADQNLTQDIDSQNDSVSLVRTFEAGLDAKAQELLKEYISRIEIDKEDPPQSSHIEDSPLFRLVNDLQSRNPD